MPKVTLAERLAVDAKVIYRKIVGERKCPRHAVCDKFGNKNGCDACQKKAYKAIAKILEKNIRRIVKEALA